MTNIETLQTEVNKFKTDLDALQVETSENIKKTKTETLKNDAENIKDKINKKIDELKSNGEEKNKSDIEKLEAMLKTLNELLTLKLLVTSKQEGTPAKETDEKASEPQDKQTAKDEKPEEKKNRFKKQRDGFSDSTEENHIWKNTGRIAAGVGIGVLAYKGLKRLFGSKEKKEEEKDDDHKEKKSRWKKTLIGLGIGAGGVLAWKNRDKIKDRFGGLFGPGEKKPPETTPNGDFENLSEEMKKKYYTLSEDIDGVSLKNPVVFSDDHDKDKQQKSEIIFDLDKNVTNLSEFNTTETLEYMSGNTRDGFLDMIKNGTKNLAYKALSGFLMQLESFKPFGLTFLSDPVKGFEDRLKAATPEAREKELSLFYKQYMNILDYVTEKKGLILYKKAKEIVMSKTDIDKIPTEEQKELIEKQCDDEEWKTSQLKTMRILDIPGLMQEYKIDKSDLSEGTVKLKKKLAQEKKEILQSDDTGISVIDRANADFADGKIEKDTTNELIDMFQNWGDDMFGNDTKIGLFGAYTHLLTDIFGGDKELANEYMKQMKYDDMTKGIQTMINANIAKLHTGTFTKEDLQESKVRLNNYLDAKENFTKHMKDIKGSNTSWFEWSKLFDSLFVQSFKDFGKLFGLGKTDSWRERVGRGLGGATVSGGILYITGSIAGGLNPGMISSAMKIGGKAAFKIGILPIELVKMGITKSLGRTYLTGSGWSEAILSSGYTSAEKQRLIKYAFLRGEISEHKARLMYEKMGSKTIKNIDELLNEFGIKNPKYIEMFKKYSDNKNIKNLLFETKTFSYVDWKDNVKHTVWDRVLKKDMEMNEDNFKRLVSIDDHLSKVAPAGTKEAKFWESFLENTKTLDKVEDFMKNKKVMGLLIEVGNTSKEPIKLAQILGKNFNKFQTVDEIEGYLRFLKTQKTNITNTNTFVRNTIGKRETLKTMDTTAQAKYIETKKLNLSFLEKNINAMKENFKKSAETLRKLIREKRTPYAPSVESTAQGLDEIANASNEDLSLLAESERIGTGNWLSMMSKDPSLLKALSPLFKDKEFLKQLSDAKTPQAVKELFASKGVNKIPEEFATTLSKTTSTTKLIDTMSYVEKYESLSKLGKVLQNPTMKYAGRMLGRVLGVGTVVLGGVMAYDKYQEGAKLKITNQARGELMQEDSFVDIGLTAAGACAFVPGIGRVAAGVILAVTGIGAAVKESVVVSLDKYTKNYKDFINSTPLLIKEHILTISLGSAGEDRGFGDWLLSTSTGSDVIKYLAAKTGSEAIKALLYTDEWKKNPLAMINIDDTELMNKLAKETPPITRGEIAEAKQQVDNHIEIKYEYLKKKCGVYVLQGKSYINIQKFVSADQIKKGEGMKLLDQLLLESEYALTNPESFGDPQKIAQQEKETKATLEKDVSKFKALEGIFAKDKTSLLYMYRYMLPYKQHLEQFGVDASGVSLEPEQDSIFKNIDYFDTYMKYKTKEQGIDVGSYSAGFVEPNYILTRDFFAKLALDKPLTDKEIYNSSSKLQTILYRIATEVIGVRINNTMEEIKNIFNEGNEKKYGIYFYDNKLDVNGNYFADTEYMGTDSTTVKNIRTDLQNQIKAGDLIDIGTGDTYLNNEIGAKYLNIIDQELVRS